MLPPPAQQDAATAAAAAAAAVAPAEDEKELVPRQLQFGGAPSAAPHWQPRQTPEASRHNPSSAAAAAAAAAARPAASAAAAAVSPGGFSWVRHSFQQQVVQLGMAGAAAQQPRQAGPTGLTPLRGAYAAAGPACSPAPMPRALGLPALSPAASGLSPVAGRGLFSASRQPQQPAGAAPSPLRYQATPSPARLVSPMRQSAPAPEFPGFPDALSVIWFVRRMETVSKRRAAPGPCALWCCLCGAGAAARCAFSSTPTCLVRSAPQKRKLSRRLGTLPYPLPLLSAQCQSRPYLIPSRTLHPALPAALQGSPSGKLEIQRLLLMNDTRRQGRGSAAAAAAAAGTPSSGQAGLFRSYATTQLDPAGPAEGGTERFPPGDASDGLARPEFTILHLSDWKPSRAALRRAGDWTLARTLSNADRESLL